MHGWVEGTRSEPGCTLIAVWATPVPWLSPSALHPMAGSQRIRDMSVKILLRRTHHPMGHENGQGTRNAEIHGEGVGRSIIKLNLRILVLFFISG